MGRHFRVAIHLHLLSPCAMLRFWRGSCMAFGVGRLVCVSDLCRFFLQVFLLVNFPMYFECVLYIAYWLMVLCLFRPILTSFSSISILPGSVWKHNHPNRFIHLWYLLASALGSAHSQWWCGPLGIAHVDTCTASAQTSSHDVRRPHHNWPNGLSRQIWNNKFRKDKQVGGEMTFLLKWFLRTT
jgi:hypothetical protein